MSVEADDDVQLDTNAARSSGSRARRLQLREPSFDLRPMSPGLGPPKDSSGAQRSTKVRYRRQTRGTRIDVICRRFWSDGGSGAVVSWFGSATRLVLSAALATLTTLAVLVGIAEPAHADNTMVSYDRLRTGWDPNESTLSPSDVTASDFGQLFGTQLDGQIYASPVVAKSTVMAVTENNNAYGLDSVSGSIKWQRNVGAAWPASTVGCGDLVPNIGITTTPTVDATTGTAYFTAKVNDGQDADHPHWYLHAVDITTGAERSGFPTVISGSPINDPSIAFNPKTAMQRPGLLLLDGVVYAGFGSHCDVGPYVGYVVGVNATTGKQTAMWATEVGSSTAGAGVWQGGGGLVSDGPGRILLSTGNGVAPPPGPGTSPPGNLSESVIRLQVNSDGSLISKDFFSPVNNTNLDTDDTDLGSGGPMGIPDGYGSASHPHLLVQVGKDGRVFLLDRDNLGGVGQGSGNTDAALQVGGPYKGVWGHPAFWGGDGGYVYTVTNGGPLGAFQVGQSGSGVPTLTRTGTSSGNFGYTSGSPVVTSDGTRSGSALVWAVYSSGSTGASAQLRAYDAVPSNGTLAQRYAAPIGNAAKFSVPATDKGRVYVGNRDGVLYGFGRPTTVALSGSPTDFGSVAVGSSATKSVTVTAQKTVTISNVATSDPFSVGSVTLPKTLNAGQTLTVPVSFSPTTAGTASGALAFTTSAGTLSFDLHGRGTKDGLLATPSNLAFGEVPTGGRVTLNVSIANSGTTTTTITSVTLPAAPFTATSVPANGSTIAPAASVSVPVTFAPTATGSFSSQLVISSSTGNVTVPLSGSAVTGAPQLTISPTDLDFGSVGLGQTVTKSFDISNTGNLVLTLTKAAPPAAPFAVASPVAEGQQLSPGDTIRQSVSFTPTALGTATGTYGITGNDGSGAKSVTVHGVGVTNRTGTILGAAGKCMDVRGSGTADGTVVQIYSCNGTSAQTWTVQQDGTIQALGKCLDVTGGGTANGTKAQLWTCNGGGAQNWVPRADTSLFNPQSGRCLDLPGGNPTDGSQLQIWDCNGGVAQQWQVPPAGPSTPGAIVGLAAKCVDVRGSGTGDGTAVQLYSCNGTSAQNWTLQIDRSLRALGKCLDVTGSGTTNGTKVQQWTCNGTGAQTWVARSDTSLFNPQSGRCLDLPGGNTTDGTQLQIWDCNGGGAQRWQLPPSAPSKPGPVVGLANKCMDVRGSGTTDGTVVQLYACNGTQAQSWTLQTNRTISALGKCLNVVDGGTTNGTKVQLWTCNGGGAQTWVARPDASIVNLQSGRCLDVPGSNSANGTQLQIWDCNGTSGQRWKVPT